MKANEAPKKLYLLPNGLISYCRNTDEDVKYTRKDVFVDKMEEYMYRQLNEGYMGCDDIETFLEKLEEFLDTLGEKEIDLGRASMKKNYPPKGEFYMYPQYDEEDNLVGFTTDYEGEGAFGKYCKIIATGEIL